MIIFFFYLRYLVSTKPSKFQQSNGRDRCIKSQRITKTSANYVAA
jgi:hypothetical protein